LTTESLCKIWTDSITRNIIVQKTTSYQLAAMLKCRSANTHKEQLLNGSIK